MTLWPDVEHFSAAFLEQHRDVVLQSAYYHLKALLLYPCGCKEACACDAQRQNIVLTLNVEAYNVAEREGTPPDHLRALRLILDLPSDGELRRHFPNAYPLWLIEQGLQDRATAFKAVGQLVWTLLRLGRTHELLLREKQASLRQALEFILGDKPLKGLRQTSETPSLGGEKAYQRYFATYRPVCYLAATWEALSGTNIEQLFKQAAFVRRELLLVRAPNVAAKMMFREDDLVPLPHWLQDVEEIPLGPFADF